MINKLPIKTEKWSFVLFLIVFCFMIIAQVTAYNITTDEITETSIIWNLSEISGATNITSISIDGYIIEGYEDNPSQIVQNNLYGGETHIIKVKDENEEITSESATTLTIQSESEKTFAFINLYVFIIAGILCLIVGLFIPFVGFGAIIFSLLGLISSINTSFEMGILSLILIVCGIVESMTFSY